MDLSLIHIYSIRFTGDTPFHFDARRFTVQALRDAAHDHEISRGETIFLHLDAAHAGIGGDMALSLIHLLGYAELGQDEGGKRHEDGFPGGQEAHGRGQAVSARG